VEKIYCILSFKFDDSLGTFNGYAISWAKSNWCWGPGHDKWGWCGRFRGDWISRVLCKLIFSSDGSGSKFFDLGRVRSGGPSMVWVWKIPPQNVKFFNFFPLDQKKSLWARLKSTRFKGRSASYLLRVKSKLGSRPTSNFYRFNCIFEINLIYFSKKKDRGSSFRWKNMKIEGLFKKFAFNLFINH